MSFLPVAHVARTRAVIPAPVDEVWSTLADAASYPQWRRNLARVEQPNGNTVREVEKKGEAMTYEIVETIPPRRLVRRIADKGLPFGGAWTIELEPQGDKTTVSITENGEVYNLFFRIMSKFIFGHHGTMVAFLEDLGTKFGEKAAVQKS